MTNVALFFNSSYVDTTSPSPNAGAVNLQQELQALGNTVTTFTGIDAASLTAALANKQAVVFPAFSEGNLNAAMTNTAKQVLANFAANGGGVIDCGDANDTNSQFLLNTFGLSTLGGVENEPGTGTVSSLISANAAGTAFAGGPANLPSGNTTTTAFTGSGGNYLSLYQYADFTPSTVVGLFEPLGSQDFNLAYLGWDWTNGGPNGTQDSGWNNILNRAVEQVTGNYSAAYKLEFAQQPTGTVAGATIAPSITVDVDTAAGAIDTADSSSITLAIASGPPGATLGGTLTEPAANGVATFSDLTLSMPGTYTLTAADGSLVSTTSATFAVASGGGTPTKLRFAVEPSNEIAGTAISPSIVVDVDNSSGGIVTTDNSLVTLAVASGPSGSTLTGSVSAQAVNGVATFSTATLSTAGTYTLIATDGALASATSTTFIVTASGGGGSGGGGGGTTVQTPVSLIFLQQPISVGAGVPTSATVEIVDSNGSVVTDDYTDITIIINSGPTGATLSGTLVVQANAGVATFQNLIFNESGTYTLQATDGSLAAGTSSLVTISGNSGGGGGNGGGGGSSASIPTQVVLTTPLTIVPVASSIAPVIVNVDDGNAQVVSGNNSTVTVIIAFGPQGGVLEGTTTVTAVNGVATFSNLSFSEAGNYALTFSDGSLTSATTGMFTVTAKPVVSLDPTSVTVAIGQTATFIANAGGDPAPTVQWQVSIDGGAVFTNVAGATDDIYTFTTSAGQNGYEYRALFTSSAGTAATIPATLTLPQSVSSSPIDLEVSIGKVKVPGGAVAGKKRKASVEAIITNLASLFKGAVELNLYANFAPTLDGNQFLLDGVTLKNLTLKSHRSHKSTLIVHSLPSNLPAGTYHLVVELVTPSGQTSLAATTETIQVT